MGAMFRSEEMALCQIFLQPETAYHTISLLGEVGCVQFRDLNPEVNLFQRSYAGEVRRSDELERKLRYIEAEINKNEISIPELADGDVPRALSPKELTELEEYFEKMENEIKELSHNAVSLKRNFTELIELRNVLEKAATFFSDNDPPLETIRNSENTEDNPSPSDGQLEFIAGVINRQRLHAFELMLWRISRGNIFLRHTELNESLADLHTKNPLYKSVFVVLFQGDQLKSRIRKMCIGFHAHLYPCPNQHDERIEMLQHLKKRIADLKLILNQTDSHLENVLKDVVPQLTAWFIQLKKMKAIYHILNYFSVDVSNKYLIAECWAPIDDLHRVQKALFDASAAAGSSSPSFLNIINTVEPPPTYHRTNKFTRGFQNLIDAYGIASYREVNPALYTIITFPFLFAIMFGDIGHGLIMLLFGGWMVIWEAKLSAKKSTSEVWNIFFGGRYIILLMSIFSIYTGFIYNDIFSKSVNIFGSAWRANYNTSTIIENPLLTLNPSENYLDEVYPFGMDPIWMMASNKIVFLNSYKMKLSIIFGVLHMIFGVVLSVVNNNYFRRPINIVLQFLPEIIFLILLFAYMGFMMFFKWIAYSAVSDDKKFLPGCAPSVLIIFINMLLMKSTEPPAGCDEFMFEGQDILQYIFVAIALVCIPWLLLAKPLYVHHQRKQRAANVGYHGVNNDALDIPAEETNEENYINTNHDDHVEEPMSEVFIHSAIHTIEYILSTISHTASYLRLWALSLAHGQLSEVLWMQVLQMPLKLKLPPYLSIIMLFILFAVWAFLSVVILVLMEGLSAFLHTLRLHWVEFMSKFYEGVGYHFEPFYFKTILDTENEV